PKILASADRLIATSFDYIATSDARQSYHEHPDRWVEIPLGVDTNRFAPRAKSVSLLTRHQLEPDRPTILFVGGMDAAHYFKGIPDLLVALALLKKSNFAFQAVFVGSGSLRERFVLETNGMGLKSMVRFVGRVSDAELPAYYNLADLLVL